MKFFAMILWTGVWGILLAMVGFMFTGNCADPLCGLNALPWTVLGLLVGVSGGFVSFGYIFNGKREEHSRTRLLFAIILAFVVFVAGGGIALGFLYFHKRH